MVFRPCDWSVLAERLGFDVVPPGPALLPPDQSDPGAFLRGRWIQLGGQLAEFGSQLPGLLRVLGFDGLQVLPADGALQDGPEALHGGVGGIGFVR